MFKRALAWALAAGTLAGVALAAASTAPAKPWQDVLDLPAAKSPLASRTLVNGLAQAGDRLVAVGQRGHVLLSDDQGQSWLQASVPSSSDLVAVAFPTPQQGWAVGHDGVVLRSTDAGANWTRVLDGQQAGTLLLEHYRDRDPALRQEAKRFAAQGAENPFLDIAFENGSTGYLVGAFGLIFRTTDGGASWQPLLHAADNPKALHLYAVRPVGGEVYVAGEQGLLLKLDRTNDRFRPLELPYKGTLFGVTGTPRALLVHGLRGTLLRSTDAGRSWRTVPTGLQVGLTASHTDAQGRIVVASQAGHVLLSRDDGASFAPVKLDQPVPAAAVALTGPSTLVIGGPRGLAPLTLP